MKFFQTDDTFNLESGLQLNGLQIAYHTYGQLNESKSNVVWICHALTADSDPAGWWPGLVGPGCAIDPKKYFIVCANILGSCYGSTGPLSINVLTGKPYYHEFPFITIRDMVNAHMLLMEFLELDKIALLIGGSMGGFQALEWSRMRPTAIEKLILIATAARETAWGIAIHTAQRLAIQADQTWKSSIESAGADGLRAARAIAMLTYRHFNTYAQTQMDHDPEKIEGFRAESYIEYQGSKLVNRFNAYSYWTLSRAMDSHNIARHRDENVEQTLSKIWQPALVIGISTDMLCPADEMQRLSDCMPHSIFKSIDSLYGHDGFLTEASAIGQLIEDWIA